MAKRKTILAGRIGYVSISSSPKRIPGEKRNKKEKPTPEAVRKINERTAIKSLALDIGYNFQPGDMHVVLTNDGEPPTPKESKRRWKNFCPRLKRYCEKNDIEYKWIMTTEYNRTRIHHHVILPKMPTADLEKIWGHGHIFVRHLDNTGDYRALAYYLVKETRNTFNDPESEYKQRYSCSRTIIHPKVEVEEVSDAMVMKTPKAPKGYYIDMDSIIQGVNPVTGSLYTEYVIIADIPIPKHKIRSKGKRKKYKPKYYYNLLKEIDEYQLTLKF